MKMLQEGKYLNKDLAEWFGISANSFNKTKDKKLEELKDFADYHLEGKRVVIDKVIIGEYSKKGSQAYQKIKEQVDKIWNEDGLDTCSRVGEEIFENLTEKDQNFELAPRTVYNYTIKGRNELYGKPFVSKGSLGECRYVWCKRNKESGEYCLLTEEEKAIKEELQTKYFGDTTEKQILVKAMVEAGEVSKEEAWETLEEMTNMRTGNFMGFLRELQEKIGCQVVKGTLVERNRGYIEFKE